MQSEKENVLNFQEALRSASSELPPPAILDALLQRNHKASVKNFGRRSNKEIINDSSAFISFMEDSLSSLLAKKRFQNGPEIFNSSAFTLSYAQTFYSTTLSKLADLSQSRVPLGDWESICCKTITQSAKDYVDNLRLQLSPGRMMETENEAVKHDRSDALNCGSFTPDLEILLHGLDDGSENLPSSPSLTSFAANLKNNHREMSENTLPSVSATPKVCSSMPVIAERPSKLLRVCSPPFTPIDHLPLVNDVFATHSYCKRSYSGSKKPRKKKLCFAANVNVYDSLDEAKYVKTPTKKSFLNSCTFDATKVSPLSQSTPKATKKYLATNSRSLSENGKENNCARSSKSCSRNRNTFKEIRSKMRCSYINNSSLYDKKDATPTKSGKWIYESPRSPLCKRLIFPFSPRAQNDLSETLCQGNGEEIFTTPNKLPTCHKSTSPLVCPRKRPTSNGHNSKVLSVERPFPLRFKDIGQIVTPTRIGRERCKFVDDSPIPYIPTPSLWAPKKRKLAETRTSPACRRNLVKRFQNLKIDHQFVDTPPGSPNGFELLLMME